MMNPAATMKIMSCLNKFKSAHPKFVAFFQYVFGQGVPEGTVIEITVTKPGQDPVTANMKVTQEDLELMESLKDISKK